MRCSARRSLSLYAPTRRTRPDSGVLAVVSADCTNTKSEFVRFVMWLSDISSNPPSVGWRGSCSAPSFPDDGDVLPGGFADGLHISGFQSCSGDQFSANAQRVGSGLNEVGGCIDVYAARGDH